MHDLLRPLQDQRLSSIDSDATRNMVFIKVQMLEDQRSAVWFVDVPIRSVGTVGSEMQGGYAMSRACGQITTRIRHLRNRSRLWTVQLGSQLGFLPFTRVSKVRDAQ